jgi:hypothetical protein
MAGILILWLVTEKVATALREKHVALFTNNSPSVSWVTRLASKGSPMAARLIQALSLQLKLVHTSPITTIHIHGHQNAITDIPSWSFGSNLAWHCKTHTDFLMHFNKMFPLSSQNSWTMFLPASKIFMRVIPLILMPHSTLDTWRQLPNIDNHIGHTGAATAGLWERMLTCRTSPSNIKSEQSFVSHPASETDTTADTGRLELQQSVALSRPLGRRSPGCTSTTPSKLPGPTSSTHVLLKR